MLSLPVLVFFVVAILAYISLKPKQRSINLPGPWGLPLIGNALDIERQFYKTLVKWSKHYGPMCKVRLGRTPMVLVADTKIAKEMLALDAFVGRANVDAFTIFEGEDIGLIASEGEMWEQQRRFVVRQLRDFGFGKSSLESLIMEECNELMERLAAYNEQPVENFKDVLGLAMINSFWSIVAGTRYSQTDPQLKQLSKQLTGAFQVVAEKGGIVAVFPWIKHVIPEYSGYNAVRKLFNELGQFVRSSIEEHKSTIQEDHSRDFIDVYLKEIKATTDATSSFYGALGEKQLIGVVSDLFQAGFETTATTLDWAVLHLLNQPEIQRKMQDEMEAITGNSRHVSLTDRQRMPYTLAVINELLRISIAPFGAPHRVLHDTELRGVFFPKGTFIFINIYYMHHDPKIWENPDSFQPERYPSEDGKTLNKHEHLNAFLFGRRQCPGEQLARDTTFLFMTNLVQRFEILQDPNSPEPDLEPTHGFNLAPRPYKVIFKERSI